MCNIKDNLIVFTVIQLILIFCKESYSFRVSLTNPLESVTNTVNTLDNLSAAISDPLHVNTLGNISAAISDPLHVGKQLQNVQDIGKNVVESLPVLNELSEQLMQTFNLTKNMTDLLLTTAVFTKNNQLLNCFGIPITIFANVVEQIFTQTTEAKDVRFYFSSRKQPNYVVIQADDDFKLEQINFDITRPTVLIAHGFMSSGQETWLKDMKNALLRLDDINVIVVDWQRGSNTWNYFSAAISTRIVGLQIARLFAQIRDLARANNNVPDISEWGMLHFIGHSLGSHICAHAAYLIKQSQEDREKKWVVGRITGLDPAQPCFRTANLTLKLDKDDAPFVDIIHTNAKHILFLGLGLPDQLGYVDFYPNGGKVQPGCSEIDTALWKFLLLPHIIVQEAICSHGRSHAFLTESIIDIANSNCTFVGYKWDRSSEFQVKLSRDICVNEFCTEMGINSASHYPNNLGVYFVPTRSSAPFCDVGDNYDLFIEDKSNKDNLFSKMAKKLL